MKLFPIEVVFSVYSRRSLCGLSQIHECAEWVLGHPVWTHELADRAVWDRMAEALLSQYPALANYHLGTVTEDNLSEVVAALRVTFGESLEVTQGRCVRHEDPIESMRRMFPDKPIIAIGMPPKEDP